MLETCKNVLKIGLKKHFKKKSAQGKPQADALHNEIILQNA
jgi:hypothetical protein